MERSGEQGKRWVLTVRLELTIEMTSIRHGAVFACVEFSPRRPKSLSEGPFMADADGDAEF